MNIKITLGIDEAGRGPTLGPMVLAAVALDTHAARALSRQGLRDSKHYGSGAKAKATRANLAQAIMERAVFAEVRVVDVAEIDRRVAVGELNALEREVADELICNAPTVDAIIADGKRMFAPLRARHPHLESVDRGESRHASVAAASVLAKHRRDCIVEDMVRKYAPEFGTFGGGGYINAPTRNFLIAYAKRYGGLPPEARRSWPYPYLSDILVL